MSTKPTFTDVDGKKVVCAFLEQNGFEYLEVSFLDEATGSTERALLLNMYDAKKLHDATNQFMQRTIAHNFADMNGQLSSVEREEMFGED
ncbi:hypothetical protein [Corynebacterium argentoratense]|uniref:hypothetical protein n=1 Tax=Corynebacterium argentoratense TaxID=42817 RepID=UPI001F3D419A|nr:hypothetical protein [Corynebacterium argentoratense]MCF1765095.1 hypothetical protein [Corynebacterium argentoratense]